VHRKIIYIINPISGTRSKQRVQNIIAKETAKAGIDFQFMPSVASGDYSYIEQIIIEEGITDVVIVGGDGTVSQVVDSLMHLPIQFGVIPCGSGNGLAFSAGIPKTPHKALDVIFNNQAHRVDGFRVNKHFACMLCGIGFDAQVAHDFAKANQRGLTTYIKKIFTNFFSAKAYSFKIKLKNKSFSTSAYFISIANSNQFGNNFTIAPKASLNDGLLDVVIVTDQPKFTLLYNTIKQVGGLNSLQAKESIDANKGVIYFQTDELTIENIDNAPVHIDGDPAETQYKLHVVIQPDCFKLLVGKKSI
jgi:lipid kinase, YegS/Rv2252/BmrU family